MTLNETVSYVGDLLQCAEQESDNWDNNIQIDTSDSHGRLTTITTRSNESLEKSSAVWTYSKTLTLLRLYENKLEMLETPKKKTRIWVAISESLRDYNITMSPDQVRWKINALTKKYKQCLGKRQLIKFKYFREMDKIYAQYNIESDTLKNLNNVMHKRKTDEKNKNDIKSHGESTAMIEVRKVRLANRIESDILQSKMSLERQWLEYLKKEEQNKLLQNEVLEKKIKIREEMLELQQQKLRQLELRLELRQLELKERKENEILRIERKKCELLYSIISKSNVV